MFPLQNCRGLKEAKLSFPLSKRLLNFHIKCGICGVEPQVDFDRAHAGIIKRLRTGMGISLLSCIFYDGQGTVCEALFDDTLINLFEIVIIY